jgi:hypothetical protein
VIQYPNRRAANELETKLDNELGNPRRVVEREEPAAAPTTKPEAQDTIDSLRARAEAAEYAREELRHRWQSAHAEAARLQSEINAMNECEAGAANQLAESRARAEAAEADNAALQAALRPFAEASEQFSPGDHIRLSHLSEASLILSQPHPGAALQARVGELEAENDRNGSPCPCTLTTPCGPHCTCVEPHSSHGCGRCARYGSEAQRRAVAEILASAIDGAAAAHALLDKHQVEPGKDLGERIGMVVGERDRLRGTIAAAKGVAEKPDAKSLPDMVWVILHERDAARAQVEAYRRALGELAREAINVPYSWRRPESSSMAVFYDHGHHDARTAITELVTAKLASLDNPAPAGEAGGEGWVSVARSLLHTLLGYSLDQDNMAHGDGVLEPWLDGFVTASVKRILSLLPPPPQSSTPAAPPAPSPAVQPERWMTELSTIARFTNPATAEADQRGAGEGFPRYFKSLISPGWVLRLNSASDGIWLHDRKSSEPSKENLEAAQRWAQKGLVIEVTPDQARALEVDRPATPAPASEPAQAEGGAL